MDAECVICSGATGEQVYILVEGRLRVCSGFLSNRNICRVGLLRWRQDGKV